MISNYLHPLWIMGGMLWAGCVLYLLQSFIYWFFEVWMFRSEGE